MGYLDLLRREPRFRRLWLGQIVSEIGDWLHFIALVSLFPTTGRAAELLAGIYIVRMLPAIVWAPLAGVVADRFPRGQVMVVADVGRAIVVLGFLLVRGPEDVVWIYALMFAQESLTAFFEPARAASLPQIVDRGSLLAANSLSGATWSAMLAIGAALGGLITALGGSRTAFVADALSFALSAVLIGGIGIPKVPLRPEEAAAHAADRFGLGAVREGAAYLRRSGAQASAAIVKGLWGLSGGVLFLYAVYAGQVWSPKGGGSSRALGILYAGRGLGALVGPLVFRRIWGEASVSLRRSIQLGFPLIAIAYVGFAYAPSVTAGALLLVAAHAGGSTCWVNSTQLLQLTVPNALQGRVFAVEIAVFTATMAASSALIGALVGRGITTPRHAMLLMAGAAAVSAIVWAAAMRRSGRALDAAADAKSHAA